MKKEPILNFISEITKIVKNNVVNGVEEVTIDPVTCWYGKTTLPEVKIKISNWKTWEELLIPLLRKGAKLEIKDSDFDCDTGEITKKAIGEYQGVDFCLCVDMDQSEQDEYDKKILEENDES